MVAFDPAAAEVLAAHLTVGHGRAQQRRQLEGTGLAAGEQARMQHGDAALSERGLAGDGIAVRLSDERLSTVSAENVLREQGRKGQKRRKVVDQVAAVVILQNALDTERSTGEPAGELVTVVNDDIEQD